MSREQGRIRRKLEKNPVIECNKVRQKYCPNLFWDFAETKDPRHLSYIDYPNGELLGTVFYKGIKISFFLCKQGKSAGFVVKHLYTMTPLFYITVS